MTEWFTTTQNDRLIHMGINDKETRRMAYYNEINMDDILKKFENEALKGKKLPKYKYATFPMTNLKQKLRCEVYGFIANFNLGIYQLILVMPENRFEKIIASYDEKSLIISQLDGMYAYEGDTFTINI